MKQHRLTPYLWLFIAAINGFACFEQLRQEWYAWAFLSGMIALAAIAFAVEDCKRNSKK